MRLLSRACFITALACLGRWGWSQPAPPLVITNVTVLPMNRDVVLPRQTVLVTDGRIQALGAKGQVKVPPGAVLLDGTGQYLLPGLTDMHAHLPGPEGTRHALATYFQLQLAAGVTSIRSMRGDSSHLRWRDSLRRTAALAPHLYLGSPVFTRDKQYTARTGRRLLTRYQAQGYDFIKYLGGLTAPQYDSLLADAHQLGLRVAGHAPRSGLRGAVAARMHSLEHIEAFAEAYQQDSVGFRQLARQLATQQQFVCPDLYWYEVTWLQYPLSQLQQLPGLSSVDPALRQQWLAWQAARQQQLLPQGTPTAGYAQLTATLRAYHQAFRLLHQAGVPFLISGGDGPFVVPGFSMGQELRLLVQQGLRPYEALRAATYNAAAWFGEQDRRGAVAVGQAADLVLLDANPLADIANVERVRGVVLQGRWIPAPHLPLSQPAPVPAR